MEPEGWDDAPGPLGLSAGFGAGMGAHEASAAAAMVRSVMCWVFINRSMIG